MDSRILLKMHIHSMRQKQRKHHFATWQYFGQKAYKTYIHTYRYRYMHINDFLARFLLLVFTMGKHNIITST